MSATVRGRGGVYELDLSTGPCKPLATGDIVLVRCRLRRRI